ncbi:MAG: efflux RND transporter periplasmic adaptor subunit [Candidatus Kapabacteria bacterium]|jgi:RND family efflux transporter MFP subunit|nr:efflux RND transporter periplasmic adaptor subunit [Candidatus Kapabacteria bacterium]
MKTARTLALAVVVIGGIAFLLMRNKATMEAKAEQPIVLIPTVSTELVEEQALSENLEVQGSIQAQNEVVVIAETQGRITNIFTKLGDRVGQGSPLVKVDSVLKYSGYIVAKANYDKAKRDVERLRELRKENNASESELESAELGLQNAKAQFIAAERQLRDAVITSPIGGTVVERPVSLGTMIAPGTPVATIVDVSTVKLKANVPEQEVLKLRVGDKVRVRADVYPDAEFTGTVSFISIKGDAAHNYPIEVVLQNSGKYPLKAGMSAKMSRQTRESRQALMIPRLAVVGSVKSPSVFVVETEQGKMVAKLKNIVVGVENGTKVEVVSGLQRGERLVVNGQNNARAGAEVIVQQ